MKTAPQTMNFRINRLLLGLALLGPTLLSPVSAADTGRAELIGAQFLLAAPQAYAPAVIRLAAQTQVEILEQRGGWKRVRALGQEGWLRLLALRPTEQAGTLGRNVPALDKPDSGNAAHVAGIHGIEATELPPAHASAYALILTIADYRNGIPRLPGVAHDADNAVLMARALNVPEANITALNDATLTLAGLRAGLDALAARVRPGDEVFLYFSGHGARLPVAQAGESVCAEALLSVDGEALPESELAERIQRIAGKARRVVAFIDASHAGGANPAQSDSGFSAKSGPQKTAQTCALPAYTPTDAATRGLISLAQGPGKFNFVLIGAAQSDEDALDDAARGGVASLAWLDCLAGAAEDLDRSGGLSTQELQICAQRHIEHVVSGNRPQHLKLSGNTRLVLAAAASPPDRADAAAVLQDIHANRDSRRSVRLSTDKAAYRIGRDRIRFSLESSHAGYVYLLMAGSDGKAFDLLFPNKKDDRNLIQANETWNLPRPGWAFRANGPAGVDRLLVLVSDQPRDFSALGMHAVGPFSSLDSSPSAARNLQRVSNGDTLGAAPDCAQPDTVCSTVYGADLIELSETE